MLDSCFLGRRLRSTDISTVGMGYAELTLNPGASVHPQYTKPPPGVRGVYVYCTCTGSVRVFAVAKHSQTSMV